MFKSHLLRSAVAVSMVATFALAGSAMAADPDDVLLVTGQNDPTIELALLDADDTAAFGSDLTPDGLDSVAADVTDFVDATNPSAGACYLWAPAGHELEVASNVVYDITVDALVENGNVYLHNSTLGAPAAYADCDNGDVVDLTMADLETNKALSAQTFFDFWLTVDVSWTDAVSASHAAASLTFTAVEHVI